MNDNIQAALNQRIETFAADITSVLQQAVADAIADALKGARPRVAAKKVGRVAPSKKAAAGFDPELILREVKRKPGQRMEELVKQLRTPSSTLIPVVRGLLEKKKIKKSGKARGTRYRV